MKFGVCMSELIEFPKSISLEESKGWEAVCEAAKRDFTSTGFPHLDLQHFFGRLVRDRYLRELEIFCKKNLS